MTNFLSKNMKNNESVLAYASTCTFNDKSIAFTISSIESQGFTWNQDIFATQYQQTCNVVYDANEDTPEKLIELIEYYNYDKDVIKRLKSRPRRRSDDHTLSLKNDQNLNRYYVGEIVEIDVESDEDELNFKLKKLIE
ncbi:hypothetical protein TBLA_0C05000 [Henningerozyma blattae CBS 6284]|uniref:Uncharacterized protein n=1 Tax=Henningerozyma blattae (strain ATCC 34711 / CBS 6284 / DSM 70876 / NBRC 10599 / NRRL Y-10934 / UCD 77-7) TaxID=1071380 RepID=I2H1P4_HENB6|nr:hypothetical protein TBLA_0C05000 [Tetrapisispora blattae CBS 6284]CCH60296.1 hypothetical protein TBLA_0C05000 [Tetrapisispora blattae CBS 6284]